MNGSRHNVISIEFWRHGRFPATLNKLVVVLRTKNNNVKVVLKNGDRRSQKVLKIQKKTFIGMIGTDILIIDLELLKQKVVPPKRLKLPKTH